jgi:hypothetical protein
MYENGQTFNFKNLDFNYSPAPMHRFRLGRWSRCAGEILYRHNMARPKKEGLDYFSIDTDFDSDEKIESIILMHQNNGLVWILRFWQKAYRTMTGLVDFRGLFAELFANKCRITIEEHQNILKTAVSVDFCHEVEVGIYTSHGIQKRISMVSKDRSEAILRQKEKVKESKVKDCHSYSANNSEQLQNNAKLMRTHSDGNAILCKEKEIKYKTSIDIPDHLKEIWPEFLKMRKLIKKPATEKAQENIIKKLFELSQDYEMQIKILNQSISNSWQGIFPIKENQQEKKGSISW